MSEISAVECRSVDSWSKISKGSQVRRETHCITLNSKKALNAKKAVGVELKNRKLAASYAAGQKVYTQSTDG